MKVFYPIFVAHQTNTTSMGLIKLGFGVAGISGKIGGSVFAKNKGGNYARSWTKPTNPQTERQIAQRAKLSTTSNAWKNLTQAQRAGWDESAKTRTVLNRFGEVKQLSGFQVYQRQNLIALTLGVGLIANAPASQSQVAYQFVGSLFETGELEFTISTVDGSPALPALTDFVVVKISTYHPGSRKATTSRVLASLNTADAGVTVTGANAQIIVGASVVEALIGAPQYGQFIQVVASVVSSTDPWDTIGATFGVEAVNP